MFTLKTKQIGKNLQSTCWYGSLFMNVYVLRPDELSDLNAIQAKQKELAEKKLKNLLPSV
jgi:hypothetical protein